MSNPIHAQTGLLAATRAELKTMVGPKDAPAIINDFINNGVAVTNLFNALNQCVRKLENPDLDYSDGPRSVIDCSVFEIQKILTTQSQLKLAYVDGGPSMMDSPTINVANYIVYASFQCTIHAPVPYQRIFPMRIELNGDRPNYTIYG